MSVKEAIIDYYDTCENDYRLFWDLDTSHAMHAGFWDETTQTLSDALRRENEVLSKMAKIGPQDKVLDAGCGIGGSSLFLANRFGCDVTGITLSAKQVETARKLAQKTSLAKPPKFLVMDFNKTSFENESFDVVWGIESICHAENKDVFIREAFRLLKPGGRLIVADGFQLKEILSPVEKVMMTSWINGWGVNALDSPGQFLNGLSKAGFQEISYKDITKNVMPSSKRLYWISFPALVMSKVGEWLGLRTKIQTANIWAARYQYLTLRDKQWQYGIFFATKP